ncbi:MAG: dienelactone hydrolase family protein [Longimicrobiales bacterium]
MNRSPTRLALVLSCSLAVAACAGGEDAAVDDGTEASGAAAMAEPRVPVAPTAADQLPSAIVGQGGALQGAPLQYVPGDTVSTGYLAVPEGAGPFPALVIVHEWNGLVDRVRQVADDFAAEGYVTLAVDLYRGRTGSNPEENMVLVREVMGDQPTMIANMNAAVAYLRGRDDVTGRIGAMGWCFGGGVALSYGLDGDDHDATAIFYGALVSDPERLATMDHEVYGTFAREDNGPSPDDVAAFEDALRAAGIENDLHIYDAVGHGFWLRVDQEPDTRTAPALDAWQRLKAYLDRTLRGEM